MELEGNFRKQYIASKTLLTAKLQSLFSSFRSKKTKNKKKKEYKEIHKNYLRVL